MIGTVIDGYKILRQLGEGGMATVYYAENSLGRRVAIKVLKEKFTRDPDVIHRFRREAQIMMKLDDLENVCRVYDCREFEGKLIIVMEYLEGMNFRDYVLKKGPVHNYDAVRRMCAQVLNTLSVAHSRNIVHRDIKPSNLFLTKGGIVKILDFGISKIVFSDDPDGTDVATQTQQKMGTISYMSPEQIRATGEVDGRTDIYSFGLTLYNLMTGNDPLDMESDSLNAIPDAGLVAAIRHAIRKNVAQRTPDCKTFLKEVQAAEKKPEPAQPAEPAKQAKPSVETDARKMAEQIFSDIFGSVSSREAMAKIVLNSRESAHYEVYMDGQLFTTVRGNRHEMSVTPGKHRFEFRDKSANRMPVTWTYGYFYAGTTTTRDISWGKVYGAQKSAASGSSTGTNNRPASIIFITGGVPCYVYVDGKLLDTVETGISVAATCPSGWHTYEFREKNGQMRKVTKQFNFAPGSTKTEVIEFPFQPTGGKMGTTSTTRRTTTKTTTSSSSGDDGIHRPTLIAVIQWAGALVLSFTIVIGIAPSNDTVAALMTLGGTVLIAGAVDYILRWVGIYRKR